MDRLPRERRAASGGEPTREQNGLVAQGSKVDFAERAAGSGGGELETGIDLAGTTRYEYTIFGNVRRVELPGGDVKVDFVDARNRRIAMKVNGVVTHRFLWQSDLRIAAEVDSTGQVLTRYVYGTQVNVPDLMIREGGTYRILHDSLGSPRLVVNTATGAIAHRMDFDEWGNVTLDTNPNFHPFGFAGGLYDSATGLTRFGARDYDPTVGRWTAKDPARFAAGAANLLTYSHGDPINLIDLNGLWVSNRDRKPWYVKKEEGGFVEVPPGYYYPDAVDGVRPSEGGPGWFKVWDGDNVTVTGQGNPDPTGLSAGGALLAEIPKVFGYESWDKLPGWKEEPGWSERHPDWRLDGEPGQEGVLPINPEDPICPCDRWTPVKVPRTLP